MYVREVALIGKKRRIIFRRKLYRGGGIFGADDFGDCLCMDLYDFLSA